MLLSPNSLSYSLFREEGNIDSKVKRSLEKLQKAIIRTINLRYK